jgi:NADPH-dependent curcumin reductase
MTASQNRQFKLAARPVGLPKRSDFEFATAPMPAPGPGEVLVKTLYLSLDPAMRGWMNEGRSYIPPVALGEVMRAGGAGRVLASNDPGFAVGDHVTGALGVQEYAAVKASQLVKVDTRVAPLPVFLGTLGMPGMTAYFGLLEVGQPEPGQTVVVSGAAGAVGSVVGQIARLKGCRAVGIAGGADKCAYLTAELGFDAAIDYKAADVRKALREHCPKGIDVYFDNVGGDHLEAALWSLRRAGRIALCGEISQYERTEPARGPSNLFQVTANELSITGFRGSHHVDKLPEVQRQVAAWLKGGSLRYRESITEGLERAPEALVDLLSGANVGKTLIRIA